MSLNDHGNLIFKYFIMLKNISNLGKTLNKAEQLTINGGRRICGSIFFCPPGSDGSDGTVCYLNGGVSGTMSSGLCCG